MNEFANLEPKPASIEVEFTSNVSMWEIGKSTYGENVEGKLIINNPDVVTYHTYGKGIITYYVEWFSESVRPLKKWNITFDNTQIKSLKFINS